MRARSSCLGATLALFALATATLPVMAQSYPNRPIKLVVPFSAGGPPDTIARLVAEASSGRLGQSVVIENRPGAGAIVGTRAVANAEPDGYTLLFGSTTSLSIGPALFKALDYDVAKSFAPVASASVGSLVVAVNADVPARTVGDLVAYARANPGRLHYGAGVGSPPHVAWALFTLRTTTDIVFVPYRAMAHAMTDLVAGQIQMMIDGIGSLLPHIREGKVRALAVTGSTRSADLADVPTMIESGYDDFQLTFWTGIVAPAGTPDAVVGTINAAINAGLNTREMRGSLARFNVEPSIASPAEFKNFLAAEAQKWSAIIKAANIRID